jgi:general secretion pathway protein F
MTQNGEIVTGVISAPTTAEVARRIDYLHLVPIDTIIEETATRVSQLGIRFGQQPSSDDVTTFTIDLALLLKAGARLDDALELLSTDIDIGRLRAVIGKIRASVLSGETFASALGHYPNYFSAAYRALIGIGEASGALDRMLEMLAGERVRTDALRRKLADALRYPTFLFFAACAVLAFFLLFVLPQFGSVLHDFGAKLDPVAATFLNLSEFVNANRSLLGCGLAAILIAGLVLMRHPRTRVTVISAATRFPLIRTVFGFYRTGLFCRNLGLLLTAGVPLTTALRILADTMATMDGSVIWNRVVEQVRQGRKLSDALAEFTVLPSTALRMLRLGEETGQLPMLAGRVAEFYETKLQRSLDRVVGIAGPSAILVISVIVGGLIVSVMTSLLSISQVVG